MPGFQPGSRNVLLELLTVSDIENRRMPGRAPGNSAIVSICDVLSPGPPGNLDLPSAALSRVTLWANKVPTA